MIGNIGPVEIGIVLIIALLVFGPKKLPELGKGAGQSIREFKESVTGDSGAIQEFKESVTGESGAERKTPELTAGQTVEGTTTTADTSRS
jgi:sec-independent protein translocase protein TatA